MVDSQVALQLRDETLDNATRNAFFQRCAEMGIANDPQSPLALVQTVDRIELRKVDEPKLGAIFVDFVGGALAHRRKFGGGRGEDIAKAVGVKKGELPSIIDGTAGLGRDAFVLAALGCKVRLVERHPVVRLLLEDGLQRGYTDPEIGSWLKENLQLLPVRYLQELDPAVDGADSVYLDPMYPHPQKSKKAQIKKEMRVFQHLVGADLDADSLLASALQLAKKRVIVKRPDYAEPLANAKPTLSRAMKSHRFDIYVKSALNPTLEFS